MNNTCTEPNINEKGTLTGKKSLLQDLLFQHCVLCRYDNTFLIQHSITKYIKTGHKIMSFSPPYTPLTRDRSFFYERGGAGGIGGGATRKKLA